MPLWDSGAWMAQCSGRAWILPTLLQVSPIYHYRLVYQVITWITNFGVYRCFPLLCSNLTRVTRPKTWKNSSRDPILKCVAGLPQPCHSRSMTSIDMVHRSNPREPIFHIFFGEGMKHHTGSVKSMFPCDRKWTGDGLNGYLRPFL